MLQMPLFTAAYYVTQYFVPFYKEFWEKGIFPAELLHGH